MGQVPLEATFARYCTHPYTVQRAKLTPLDHSVPGLEQLGGPKP